jgi:hypothetical protein
MLTPSMVYFNCIISHGTSVKNEVTLFEHAAHEAAVGSTKNEKKNRLIVCGG